MKQHDFPADLIEAQRDWYVTYGQLADAPTGTQTTVLRRRLQRLSVRISTHPYWASLPGTAPAARMELKALTWTAASERSRWPAAPPA
jgi:hypothetical protein